MAEDNGSDQSTSRLMDQEIKEEPLGDEERPLELLDHDNCLLKPKLEEIDDFVEPKQEEFDNFLQPKSEVLDQFLVPKLEAPEYFHTEQLGIKLEPVEVVKQELLVPKLEEPDYSEMDCSFEYSNYMDSAQEKSPESEEAEMNGRPILTFPILNRKKRKQRNNKCVMCNSLVPKVNNCTIHSNKRKLILLVARICAEKKTEEALQLITGRTFIICKIHLSEAVDEIYRTLNIKNIQEIDSCSDGNKQKLMNVVKSLCCDVDFDRFVEFLSDFLKKVDLSSEVKENMSHFSPAALKNPKWTSIYHPKRHTCSVCSLIEIESELTRILSRGRLLALMVGCVLSGKKTVEKAQLVLSKTRIFTCGRHVSEAVKEIFKAVNIKKVDEMRSCSMENKEKLMNTVNSLSPSVSFLEFCSIFKHFCLIFND